MSHGGIFNGPTALGIVEQGVFRNPVGYCGLGAVSQPCIFATAYPVGGGEATRAIQHEMVKRGATKLKVDGYWGNCSESAYQKLFGIALSKASIESNFPITCSTFSKTGTFVPKNCTNGTDVITAPPTPEVVQTLPPPTPTTPPVICHEGYINDPLTGGCKLIPGGSTPPAPKPPAPKPPAPKPPAPTPPKPGMNKLSAEQETSDQWIKGIPNLAVIGVGSALVVLGVGIIAMKRK